MGVQVPPFALPSERFSATAEGHLLERSPAPDSRIRRADLLVFLACAILSSAYCVSTAVEIGPTFDEPDYVNLGMVRWRTWGHNLFMHAGVMPLSAEVQTFPLWLAEVVRGERFDVRTDTTPFLPWARAANLPFWWAVLWYGGYLGRQLAGRWAGRLATVWLAGEPNLLAHASLATTDLSITACLLALFAYYRAGRIDEPARWLRRVGLPMYVFDLAVLAKASAVVFGPLVLLAVELERFVRTRRAGVLDAVQILGGGFVLAVFYFGFGSAGSFRGEEGEKHHPHGRIGESLWTVNRYARSNAVGAITFQMKHQEDGHGGCVLLGEWHPTGVWYYFPVALALKTSLPLLVALLGVAVARPRRSANVLLLAAGLLLAYSLAARVQIGVRLFLPVIAFAVIGVSAALVRGRERSTSAWCRRLIPVAATAAVGWTTVGSLAVWPNALGFANELAGGPSRNHRNLSDSNHDWGQGLPELAAWQRAHPDVPLCVWYFGTDPLLRSGPWTPFDPRPVPPAELADRLRGHRLAVSTTYLSDPTGARFRAMRPTARTTTFLIFEFR